jgi:2,5-dioxopentanoate dehydrogenase
LRKTIDYRREDNRSCMDFHGKNFVGATLSAEGNRPIYGYDPKAGKRLETAFLEATPDEIDRALGLAADAAPALRSCPSEKIAGFLDTIASEIEALGDELLQTASAESGLPIDRLTGERARTVNQLRLFGRVVRDGSYLDVRIDPALPDRKPLPRHDLRRMMIPLGPVVMFGASNFPLAFSVAGGDTTAAFAAKNPVVVKAHPAHPGTSELVAGAIQRAVQANGLPAGTFSMVHAADPELSLSLVLHPDTKAVTFTGSERVGRAIFDAAAQRPQPIPVYVEMGSINPVFVLPGALEERRDAIAQGLFQSINLSVGQFCVSPGVVVGAEGDQFEQFTQKLNDQFRNAGPGTMLHPGILQGYNKGVEQRSKVAGVDAVKSTQQADAAKTEALPVLFETDAKVWLDDESLATEIFGPSSLIVKHKTREELLNIASSLPGSLTATIFGSEQDLHDYADLLAILEAKAGRLVLNGYPTGVEVTYAMNHGGPYPATTDPKFTSVGTASIARFLRPVCYQNFPQAILPVELRDVNERRIWRTIDGVLTKDNL